MRIFLDRWYLLVPCAALVVFASLVVLLNEDWGAYQSARNDISQAQSAEQQAYTLTLTLYQAETAQREFVSSGSAESFRECQEALSQARAVADDLARSTHPGVEGGAAAAALARVALTEIGRAVDLRQKGDAEGSHEATRASRTAAESARAGIRQLTARQRSRIEQRIHMADRGEQRVHALVLSTAVGFLLLLVGASIHVTMLINRLRNAQGRYRLLFDNNPQPMWAYDTTTLAFLAVNTAAVRHYGYSKEEFLRMNLRDIRPAEDIEALEEATRQPTVELQKAGKWRHTKKDGSVIVVDIIEHPIVLDGHSCFLVTPRDITEMVHTETELRKSRERLQLTLDAANEGLWDWNVITGDGYFSPRYQMILGYQPGEIGSDHQSWRSLVHPDDLGPVTEKRAEQIARHSGSFVVEYRMRKRGGDYVWVQSRGKVIAWTPEGKPARIVGTITDIHDRKTLEAQFQQAQRLESIGRLAGGVAHDFNNLLTVINGYADMALGRTDPNHPAHDSLEEIRKAGERAAGLTQQLLAFSRKQLMQMTVVNINRSVSEVDNMLRRLIGEHIRLVTHLAADLGNTKADPGQLLQVVVNLAVNGRDAMPEGGILTIETANVTFDEEYSRIHPTVRPGDYVMLAISDNGVGMTPEVKEQIFEPFFTTKAKGLGTGLGLSMVHGIVMQSGGFIWVYSEPGRGTTFKVYFPQTEESARSTVVVPASAARGTETILVVEDQKEVRDLTARVLRHYGYNVHACASGEEGLHFSHRFEGPIDLLVSDVIMPGMNGMALARAMTLQRRSMRILLMSGYTDDALTQGAIVEEGIAYLQKPFTPEQLATKVREMFREESKGPGQDGRLA